MPPTPFSALTSPRRRFRAAFPRRRRVDTIYAAAGAAAAMMRDTRLRAGSRDAQRRRGSARLFGLIHDARLAATRNAGRLHDGLQYTARAARLREKRSRHDYERRNGRSGFYLRRFLQKVNAVQLVEEARRRHRSPRRAIRAGGSERIHRQRAMRQSFTRKPRSRLLFHTMPARRRRTINIFERCYF